jgi:hypothetical protein
MSNGGGSHTAVREEREKAKRSGDGMPHKVDSGEPNAARIYDLYLGGKDHYPADREAARRVLGAAPDAALVALENRDVSRVTSG